MRGAQSSSRLQGLVKFRVIENVFFLFRYLLLHLLSFTPLILPQEYFSENSKIYATRLEIIPPTRGVNPSTHR